MKPKTKSVKKILSMMLCGVIVFSSAGILPASAVASEQAAPYASHQQHSVLEPLTISLYASNMRVMLAAQDAVNGHTFYYTTGMASASAPTAGDNISTINGAVEYSTSTDIGPEYGGSSGSWTLLDPLYVQVYKVETTGNTIVGYGESTARNILDSGNVHTGTISVKQNGNEVGTFTYVYTEGLYTNEYLLEELKDTLPAEYRSLLAPKVGSELAFTNWYKNHATTGNVSVDTTAAAEKSNWASVSSIVTNILGCQPANPVTDSGAALGFQYKVSGSSTYEVVDGSLQKSDKQVVTGIGYTKYAASADAVSSTLPANAGLTVNGVSYVASGNTTGAVNIVPGASYDLATNTLTLSGYSGGAIKASEMDLKLVLIGDNTVTGSESMGVVQAYSFDNSPKLTISGSGTLTVNNTKSTGTSYGIYGWTGVDIQSGTVVVNMTAAGYTYGIGTNRYPITVDVSQGASVASVVAGGTNAAHAMVGSAVNITGSSTIKEGDNEAGAQTVSSLTMTTIDVGEATKKYVAITPASTPQTLTASTFAELQTALQNVQDGGTIQITASFNTTGTLTLPNAKSITITSGAGGPFTLTRSGFTGEMLVVPFDSGLHLTNLVLDGNKSAVEAVGSILRTFGNTTLGGGAVLQNNNDTGNSGYGGGVEASGGSLTIDGAIIRNNHAEYGGGVYVNIGATFLLTSGEISGNTTEMSGGGIFIDGDTLGDATATMNGGSIKNNAAGSYGGGISNAGALVVNGGSITGNTGIGSAIYTWTSSNGTTTVNSATITCAVRGKITGSDAPNGLAATIQLKQNGSNVGSPVTAGADGTFHILDVPRGTGYSVSASMAGYTTGTSSAFSIEYDDARDRNLSLTKQGQPTMQYTISVSASPTNGGTVTGGGTFDANASKTVTATANSGYEFVRWTENGATVSTSPSYTFTLIGNRSLVAVFNDTGGGSGGYNPPVIYYTLRFETGSGSDISSVRETYNAYIDLTKYVPTWRGHTFIGWYSERSLMNKVSGVYLTKDMTVYAGWRVDENPNTGANPFTDVSEKDWFYGDVMFVYENGLMLGTSKTLFSPYGTATRGMMATILWRMEGSPAPKGGNGFSDVDAGKWYADAITWTAENGIFAGYGKDKLGPDNPITREQLAAIFYRYADYKGYDLTVKGNLDKFKDADKITDYAKTAMQWAVGSGLVKGKSGNLLDPQGTATRAEIAAMLHRFIEKYELVQGKAPGA